MSELSSVKLTYFSVNPSTPNANGNPVPWQLHVESIDKAIEHTISVIPLPVVTFDAFPFNNRPIAWALNLGMMSEAVVLHGVCKDNDTDPTFPTYTQLEEIVRCAATGIRSVIVSGVLNFTNGIQLEIFEGEGQGSPGSAPATTATPTYNGLITAFTGHRDGGDTYWSWTMTFSVVDWSQVLFATQGTGEQ